MFQIFIKNNNEYKKLDNYRFLTIETKNKIFEIFEEYNIKQKKQINLYIDYDNIVIKHFHIIIDYEKIQDYFYDFYLKRFNVYYSENNNNNNIDIILGEGVTII